VSAGIDRCWCCGVLVVVDWLGGIEFAVVLFFKTLKKISLSSP
jgi:hypothetical protein